MNTVISLNNYKREFKQPSINRTSMESIAPRYELFKERSKRQTTILTNTNIRWGISIMFGFQNIASSIDSSIITKYALFPIAMICKVVAKRQKRKLALDILALTTESEYR